MNQNNSNSRNSSIFSDILSRISHTLRDIRYIPFFVDLIIILTLSFYILSYFSDSIPLTLANFPYNTLLKFQIWRLFTSIFITTRIVNILMSFIFWVREGSKLEKSIGTIKYGLIFFINSINIRIIYSIIIAIYQLISKNKFKIDPKKINSLGIWPVIICELNLLCSSNPNIEMRFLCLPIEFKARYYPFFLLLISGLFNDLLADLEMVIAILYSFLYHYFLKSKFTITNSLVKKIENFCLCKFLKGINSFISIDSFIANKINNNTVTTVTERNVDIATKETGLPVKGTYENQNSVSYTGVEQDSVSVRHNINLDKKI